MEDISREVKLNYLHRFWLDYITNYIDLDDVECTCPFDGSKVEWLKCTELCGAFDELLKDPAYARETKVKYCPCYEFGVEGALERLQQLLKKEGLI